MEINRADGRVTDPWQARRDHGPGLVEGGSMQSVWSGH